jgi:hypothetical protein
MHIFLSYSSVDRDLADRIRLTLIGHRHDVFFDRTGLSPGAEYDRRIAEEIQRTDLFIFLITPESISTGRYTLNELGLAQRKWKHPARHVLPVMIRLTPMEQIPPYLKAITVLQPTGDIAAEVADHVRRLSPSWPRRWRWAIGSVSIGLLVAALWGLFGMSAHARQASELLQSARSLQSASEYAPAWDKILEARTQVVQAPLSSIFHRALTRDVIAQQVEIATTWLDNMRLKENEKFSDVASRLLPTLDEAIATEAGERKADLLAYRGWADFLRSRDSGQQLSPDSYYRQALEVDPSNVYAHTMWGHWIIWRHGKLDDAISHFNAALASGRQRPYVRARQFSAMMNAGGDDDDVGILRIAHEMWRLKEPIPQDANLEIRRVYIFACGRWSSNDLDKLLKAMPETEHIALIRDLFPLSDPPRDQPFGDRTFWVQPCLARLQEHAGLKTEALQTYRALQSRSTSQDEIWHVAKDAIKRLSGSAKKTN